MATAKIILFTSKTLKDNRHPLMMRLINGHKIKYISIGMKAKPDELEGMRFKSSVTGSRNKNKAIRDIENRIDEIIENFTPSNPFSFEKFENKYRGKKETLTSFIDDKISNLKKAEKVGNAMFYVSLKNILKGCFKHEITFTDVDKNFLKKLVSYLQMKGNANTTIYMRLRTLRAVLNDSEMKPEQYPFKNQYNPNGFEISDYKGGSNPRALKKDEINRIKNLDLNKYPHLELGKNLFMFSYWCRGINFTDLARLTIDNVKDDRIKYVRKKTGKDEQSVLMAPAYEILRDYYNFPSKHYLFPVLDENIHITEQQKYDRIKKVARRFNDQLSKIAEICKINEKITSYYARHSFAKNLRGEGVSDSVISELLNHADEKTTKHYLDSFGKDELDEAQERLL